MPPFLTSEPEPVEVQLLTLARSFLARLIEPLEISPLNLARAFLAAGVGVLLTESPMLRRQFVTPSLSVSTVDVNTGSGAVPKQGLIWPPRRRF